MKTGAMGGPRFFGPFFHFKAIESTTLREVHRISNTIKKDKMSDTINNSHLLQNVKICFRG